MQIQLIFNESLDSVAATDVSHYVIEPSLNIVSAAISDSDLTIVELTISTAIDSNVVYTIIATGISDCSGNVATTSDSIQFALPSPAISGEILLNEILFNPKFDGYDYVEIYNNSDKVFDLKDWQLANADEYDSLTSLNTIIEDQYLFFPEQYLVLTENATAIKQQYYAANPDWFIEMNLPSLNDDEGTIIILNTAGERIDQLHYSESWQFPLIDEPDGVALERISFDAPTQDALNWHSAASTVGYGTPSYENSQHVEPLAQNEISIEPKVFSPDQDGYNDVVAINYQFSQPGFIGNVKIFNSRGTQIRDLVHNALLPSSGTFIWDGITDANDRAPIGIYIILTEIFDLSGSVKHYKHVCVVGEKKR
ncbi:MAG: lamin tail domain-containing protein [Chitinophagales bacterium]|nr:lamin tail domain-containing protein [Chitinophagales bacterium]